MSMAGSRHVWGQQLLAEAAPAEMPAVAIAAATNLALRWMIRSRVRSLGMVRAWGRREGSS